MVRHDLNAFQLARAVGVTHPTIGNFLKGAPPNAKHLAALADYFKVSTDFLLGRESSYDSPPEWTSQMIVKETEWSAEEQGCIDHLKNFLRSCSGDRKKVLWTQVELEEHFPLSKWEKQKKTGPH